MTAEPMAGRRGADALKLAFRMHPMGIGIIAAPGPDGPIGLTASSISSVGIDPPTLSFSVTRATGSAGGILSAESYVVHLLDSRHQALAESFAVSGSDRFTEEQGWVILDTGEPYLPDTRAALRCRTLHQLGVGSSVVVIAEVLEVLFGDPADPMVYQDRAFHPLG